MQTDGDDPNVLFVDIAEWVERARTDQVAYLERQATEVVLAAIGMTAALKNRVFLKGGILMGVAYHSLRQTADVDFTTTLPANQDSFVEISNGLATSLPRAAAELGYPDLVCQVQSHKFYPTPETFDCARGPALRVKIAYARRGSSQAQKIPNGNCPDVLSIDISFREPVGAIQILKLGQASGQIAAYSLADLLAEKLRALLQQPIRKRNRRQDIYDIASLIGRFPIGKPERSQIHKLLLRKCAARDLTPTATSLSESEVRERAGRDWHTLRLEIGEVPDFDACFARVEEFYKSLPWGS
ncbi:MAG: nucleotidyl transferase AbiEii/AbiGii toxin family protein [Rhodospirillaceae bacterium]|nr:nucleotidyl transferase AbiEii/AbiGii toxin family protein [Rhodospirillaceae bacterium]